MVFLYRIGLIALATVTLGTNLFARYNLSQLFKTKFCRAQNQPLTVKLLYPDNQTIILPAHTLKLFPTLARVKKENSYIRISDLPKPRDPFVSLDYENLNFVISFVINVTQKQQATSEDIRIYIQEILKGFPRTSLETLLHTLKFLNVDDRIFCSVAQALLNSRAEDNSFLSNYCDELINLNIRWHPHSDWKLLNLSDMSITHISDIAFCVYDIPAEQVEVLSLKDNDLRLENVSVRELDQLYRIFPHLKQIII